MGRFENLVGKRFGSLVVDAFAGRDAKAKVLWHAVCDCGGEKVTRATNLKRGSTKSCGCLIAEQSRISSQHRRRDHQRERRAWGGMLRRCYSDKHPSHHRYAAAGITVCDRWRYSFANFYEDMGKCPPGYTLGRSDNSSGYSPDNCKWASRKEQANNRSSNVLLTFNGETHNIGEWSAIKGWHKSVIVSRLRYGWSVERALSEEPRKNRHV